MATCLYDTESGATIPLHPQRPFVIGRSREVDLTVGDGTVARRHARLVAEPAAGEGVVWRIYDMRTTNGTFVNGDGVGQHGIALRPGDVIRLANMATYVFQSDDAPQIEARPSRTSFDLRRPEEIAREAALDIIADGKRGYRDAPSTGMEKAARDALERLESGDVASALEALLRALDVDGPPSPRFEQLATYLVAISSKRAGELLRERAFSALAKGGDAVPYATLLASTEDHESMFELRNHAGRLRDAGRPEGAIIVHALRETKPNLMLHVLREYVYPPPTSISSDVSYTELSAKIARAISQGSSTEDADLVRAVVAAMRQTPSTDLEKRAALRRMLEDLTATSLGPDPNAWLR